MPRNNRLPSTVTRSISFRFDVIAALDQRAEQLRSDRSSVLNGTMEHVLGIMAHPEIVGRNTPFVEDVDREWEPQAKIFEHEARRKSPVKVGGLVRRPAGRR